MAKISQKTIDQIRNAIDIVDVINDFVTLKKKGKDMKALCPFHNEKTPSFSVSPARGIFKCFGCGKGGDAITFVMEIEGYSYYEALKYLANKYGIQIEEEEFTDENIKLRDERESLFIAINFAKKYFQNLLFEHPEGQSIGMTYLKERRFNEQTIKDFELGYSLNKWDDFYNSALKNGYNADILQKAGLIIQNKSSNNQIIKSSNNPKPEAGYDRFRGRVIFPIHNLTGKVIAFGARILSTHPPGIHMKQASSNFDKDQPKYINSPECEIYNKSETLFGIFQAKPAIRQEDNCYLVEGYTDVISLHQAGIHNVVASSGTSLTEYQVKLIGRFTTNITILFDGDSAGIAASTRGIDMILEIGLNVKVIVFPENEDPDSYLNKTGTSDFKAYLINNQKDFITFKTELYLKDAENDPNKKTKAIREVITSISKIPDSLTRSQFLKQYSKLLDCDENELASELRKKLFEKKNKAKYQTTERTENDEQVKIISSPEQEVMKLLIRYNSIKIDEQKSFGQYVLEQINDIPFQTPVFTKILDIIKIETDKGNILDENFFLTHQDEEIKKQAINLVSEPQELSNNWAKYGIHIPDEKDILSNVAYITILHLKWNYVKKLIQINRNSIRKIQDTKQIEQSMKVHLKLKEDEREIASELGNIVARA